MRIELAIIYQTIIRMFGMAMKFLQLGLEPINPFTTGNSPDNQTISRESKENDKQKETNNNKKAKSTETINAPDLQVQNNVNIPLVVDSQELNNNRDSVNILRQQKTSQSVLEEDILEELKQSQQKVLEDFKKSIQRSIAISSRESLNKVEKPKGEEFDLVEGIVLSKIEQLSEEYLEFSIRKQLSSCHPNLMPKLGSVNLDNHSYNNKSSSCELIKSIVKSVLLPESVTITQTSSKFPFEDIHFKQSSVKRCNDDKNSQTLSGFTGNSHASGHTQKQPITQFIKELFESLGLIDKEEKMGQSLREMTENARKKFNSLRGNDYVEKLNEMLQSVQGIENGKVFGLKDSNRQSIKNSSSSAPIRMNEVGGPQSGVEHRTRKEILIKRESEKKVKIVSPQTLSELESKRNLIDKEISEALQFLTVSRRMRKFSFHSTAVNEVVLNFSYDFQFMSYKRVKKGFFSQVDLLQVIRKFCQCTKIAQQQNDPSGSVQRQPRSSMIGLRWNLVNVTKGVKTKNFIRFEELLSKKKEQRIDGERCLSLLFKDRTYDLECESPQIRDQYYRAIKILLKSTCDI